jgi:ABC-2 type transport system permease protein
MTADTLPVTRNVLVGQRRSLLGWSIALVVVPVMYTSFYPSMGGGEEMQALLDSMPEGLVTALGYDAIGTAAGYLQSTVYGLLGPILLLVYGIAAGARLFAGQEEDGTLELELTSPVGRRDVFVQRLLALWLDVLVLVAVMTAATWLILIPLGMDVAPSQVLAGSTGLVLLVLGFTTLALAVGAATGRRAVALGVAAALAVAAFMLNAIGPAADVGWMTTVSPMSWYIGNDPVIDGFDVGGLLRLALVPVLAALAGWWAIDHRDLMV